MSKHKHRSTRQPEPCPACGRDHDTTGSICRNCLSALRRALVDLPAYWSDVDTVRTGQTRYATGAGTRGSDIRLGMDLRFGPDGYGTRVLASVKAMLVGWVLVGVEEHPGWEWPADTVPGVCCWLREHADWLRSSVHGPLAYEQVCEAVTSLRSLIDRPADRWYAGVCGTIIDDWSTCKAELRPRKPEGKFKCAACGTLHDIAQRRDELLKEARSHIARADTIAGALCAMHAYDGSSAKLGERIAAWVRQGRLLAGGHEVHMGRKRPMYVIGDVLDLVVEEAQHAEKSRGRRRAS